MELNVKINFSIANVSFAFIVYVAFLQLQMLLI